MVTPYGSRTEARRIAVNLPNIFQPINVKKVRRLMKLMGIEAIYPKANLSKPDSEHKIFPYLLRGKKIEKVNRSGEPSSMVN